MKKVAAIETTWEAAAQLVRCSLLLRRLTHHFLTDCGPSLHLPAEQLEPFDNYPPIEHDSLDGVIADENLSALSLKGTNKLVKEGGPSPGLVPHCIQH